MTATTASKNTSSFRTTTEVLSENLTMVTPEIDGRIGTDVTTTAEAVKAGLFPTMKKTAQNSNCGDAVDGEVACEEKKEAETSGEKNSDAKDDGHKGDEGEEDPQRTLPFYLFYDEEGSIIYEKITELPEYYLTRAEAALLKEKGQALAESSAPDTLLVELGSGSSTKTRLLLDPFIKAHGSAHYVPIDISRTMLEASARELAEAYGPETLKITALHGTYDAALEWLGSSSCTYQNVPKMILFLGSSIGNFDKNAASSFLRSAGQQCGPKDRIVVGMDLAKDPAVLEAAYDDSAGVTADFNKNLLRRINAELGADFDVDHGWRHGSKWIPEPDSRIEMRLYSTRTQAVRLPGLAHLMEDGQEPVAHFKEGEFITTEHCNKFTLSSIHMMAAAAGLSVSHIYTARNTAVWEKTKPNASSSVEAESTHPLYDPANGPGPLALSVFERSPQAQDQESTALRASCEESLKAGWKLCDGVFSLLSDKAWLERPITLRHPFIFYLGHLAAFAYNQAMNHTLQKPKSASPNAHFDDLFERGMDPNVMDPTKCHNHSAAFGTEWWPSVSEIKAYRDAVRDILLRSAIPEITALQSIEEIESQGLSLKDLVLATGGRAFHEICEHDFMHSETLLYMFASMDASFKVKPSPEALNYITGPSPLREGGAALPETMVEIPAGPAVAGADIHSIDFGWDCEFPRHKVHVQGFRVSQTPTTNEQFRSFVESGGYSDKQWWTSLGWEWKEREGLKRPYTWVLDESNNTLTVRTAFDFVPFHEAADWPVYVSQEEAAAYARWKGKRLMSEVEFLRAAYSNPVDDDRSYPWGEEKPVAGKHGNFDFFSYAPTPVGYCKEGVSGFGVHELVGNGWEWTSTVFEPLAGFTTYMPSYKGYSADFYDGSHNVMLGASWATGARLVRRSFRNWFQPNYQYVFSKFRLAEDL